MIKFNKMDRIITDNSKVNESLLNEVKALKKKNKELIVENIGLKEQLRIGAVSGSALLTVEKNERQLFEAFLNGYDAGYDAKGSDMINHNVGDAVRYIRRNFNEDFEL